MRVIKRIESEEHEKAGAKDMCSETDAYVNKTGRTGNGQPTSSPQKKRTRLLEPPHELQLASTVWAPTDILKAPSRPITTFVPNPRDSPAPQVNKTGRTGNGQPTSSPQKKRTRLLEPPHELQLASTVWAPTDILKAPSRPITTFVPNPRDSPAPQVNKTGRTGNGQPTSSPQKKRTRLLEPPHELQLASTVWAPTDILKAPSRPITTFVPNPRDSPAPQVNKTGRTGNGQPTSSPQKKRTRLLEPPHELQLASTVWAPTDILKAPSRPITTFVPNPRDSPAPQHAAPSTHATSAARPSLGQERAILYPCVRELNQALTDCSQQLLLRRNFSSPVSGIRNSQAVSRGYAGSRLPTDGMPVTSPQNSHQNEKQNNGLLFSNLAKEVIASGDSGVSCLNVLIENPPLVFGSLALAKELNKPKCLPLRQELTTGGIENAFLVGSEDIIKRLTNKPIKPHLIMPVHGIFCQLWPTPLVQFNKGPQRTEQSRSLGIHNSDLTEGQVIHFSFPVGVRSKKGSILLRASRDVHLTIRSFKSFSLNLCGTHLEYSHTNPSFRIWSEIVC
ncbi:unnamed protein product [Calicophoron daubneyi]|uniref:Uncharacterized protein n=1 Tax=Calicophoron daubneyi TaxID=300641 RepID=A0AAV2T423_CALDB